MRTTKSTWHVVASAAAILMLAGCGVNRVTAPQAEPEARLSLKELGKQARLHRAAAAAARTPSLTPELPVLSLVAGPQRALRIMPVQNAHGEFVDATFSPAAGVARFELRAPAAGLIVSKVKIEVGAEGVAKTAEATPRELALPDRLAGATFVEVPFGIVAALQALAEAPGSTELHYVITLIGPDGSPLAAQDGLPTRLEMTVDVI